MLIKPTLKVRIVLLIAILITAGILFLSLIRVNNMPQLDVKSIDKYYHLVAYFFLTLSWLVYFNTKYKKLKNNYLILIILILTIFGIVVEVLQRIITDYRLFDYQDMIANTIGVLFATSLFLAIRKKVF